MFNRSPPGPPTPTPTTNSVVVSLFISLYGVPFVPLAASSDNRNYPVQDGGQERAHYDDVRAEVGWGGGGKGWYCKICKVLDKH